MPFNKFDGTIVAMIFILIALAVYVVQLDYNVHSQPLPYVCVDKVKYYDFFRHGYAVAYDRQGNIKLCGETNETIYVMGQ